MRIVVIGSGRIGGTLTWRLAQLGHDVVVANARGPETLEDLVRQTGATATSTSDLPLDAAQGAIDAARPEQSTVWRNAVRATTR